MWEFFKVVIFFWVGVYFFEEFDVGCILVLFIYGIGGILCDLRLLIDSIDCECF